MGEARVAHEQLIVSRQGDAEAKVSQGELVVSRAGDPAARALHEQLVVSREGSPSARVSQGQLIVCRPNVTEPDAYAASPTFKAMAKRGNRQPVTLLSIESAGAAKFQYTTQSQWQGSALTRIDTTTVPGSAIALVTHAGSASGYSQSYAHYPLSVVGPWHFRQVVREHWYVGVIVRLTVASGGNTITSANYFAPNGGQKAKWEMSWHPEAWGNVALTAQYNSFVWLFYDTLEVAADAAVTYGFRFFNTADGSEWTGGQWQAAFTSAPTVRLIPQTASLVTSVVDTGSIPDNVYVFGADDILGAGSAIAYSVEGRNLSTGSWTPIGTVVDGDLLPAYRYYRITAVFSAVGPRGAELKELTLSEGDYIYFTTHDGEPVEARPLVKRVSSLTSKIQFDKGFPSTGEISPELAWTKASGDLIASGTLKNKSARVKLGFRGLSLFEYQDFHTGTFYDWSASIKNRTISIKIRDVLKQFEKVKIPFETTAPSGSKTTTPIIWASVHPIQAMLDIFDYMGLASRYIPFNHYVYLRDGIFIDPMWRVTRTLSDPTSVSDLLSELSMITGVFLIPTPDGKITPVLYDPEAAPVATFDATVQDFDDIDGNQKDLFTRQAIYYNPKVADPSGEEDYYNLYLLIDAAAEIARGGEASIKTYLDQWKIGGPVAAVIAARWAAWYVDPLVSVKVKNVSAYYIDVLPGQIVAVDNLELPITADRWGDKTVGKKFLVTSRTVDPRDALLSFELRALDNLMPENGPTFTATDIQNDWTGTSDEMPPEYQAEWTGSGWQAVSPNTTYALSTVNAGAIWERRPKSIKIYFTGGDQAQFLIGNSPGASAYESTIASGETITPSAIYWDGVAGDLSPFGAEAAYIGFIITSAGIVITAIEFSDEDEPAH